MKHWLLIALSLVALAQVCQAASDDTNGFCDPQSENFYRRQSPVAWKPVPRERIAEADYYERTFEARIKYAEQELFAYKVMMNIRGKPIHAFVALLDRRETIIDIKPMASKARIVLQEEAMDVAREQHATAPFLSLSSNKYDILLWPWRSSLYFSVVDPERFSVFETTGNTVGYICTYRP